jgi:5'-phosphate synthase pdxT subunit
MWKLIDAYELAEPIRALHRRGGAVLGTCAGMIVAARDAVDAAPGQELLDLIDITVRRNAFGRQVASFETPVALRDDAEPMPGVFIRAPWIEATGPGVDVVATVDGRPVAARGGNVLVTAFHPELTEDRRVHREFAEMVAMRRREAA